MAIYLLSAAVNYDATICDGNDLSVIRGSSLTVLRFGEGLLAQLIREFGGQAEVEPLFSGASELMVRIGPKPVALPARPSFDAPVGSNQKWRKRTLPALLDEIDGGAAVADVAAAWVEEHGKSIRGGNLDGVKRSIVRQLEFKLAEQDARGKAAKALPFNAAAVDGVVEAFFRASEQAGLRHFCFAHACVEPPLDRRLADVMAALYSGLRTRQLQQLTVVLPAAVERVQAAEDAFCPFTLGRQPAAPGKKEKGQPISASALARRREGRHHKQEFYRAQIERSAAAADKLGDADASQELAQAVARLSRVNISFAKEFATVVADPPREVPPNVRGKLAVIYFDGNGFSAKRQRCADVQDAARASQALRDFCLALERNGGLILARLLPWMAEAQRGDFVKSPEDDPILRFETLLFGGDDICFVLPAWGAFAFMDELLKVLRNLRAPVDADVEALTFKAGMVLADHKSPIRDLRNVAEALAHAAKATSASRNIVQAVALEGIDRADLDPAHLRRDLFGEACAKDAGAFGLEGGEWSRLRTVVERITRDVGRSQLHDWYAKAEAHGLLSLPGDNKAVRDFIEAFDARLAELDAPKEIRPVLTGADPLLASGAARWPLLPLYHVLTLANYVDVLPLGAAAGKAAA